MPTSDSRKASKTKTPGVYKRNGSYVVRWKHRGKSCKRHFPTYAEAREFKRTLHGAAKCPTTTLTVADYFDGWIDSYRGRTARGLEATSRTEYRRSFELHVLPYPLGRERLREVTSRDIDNWFADLERAEVPAPTIRKAKAGLSAMMATAAQAGDIPASPVTGVRYVPTMVPQKRQRRALGVEDVEAIMAALAPQWKLFFAVLLRSGCRVSELLGLTWKHVHLGDSAHLAIVEQVYKGQRKRLKTAGSERMIPLSVSMAQALHEWKDASTHARPDDPVFPSAVGTPLTYSNVYNRVLQPALKASGLDGQGVGFHAFRKACGSLLFLRAGKDPRQVQRWLGHSQLTTTLNIYVHELDEGLGGAEDLDAVLRGHRGDTDPPQSAADKEASHEQIRLWAPASATSSKPLG